MVAMNVQVRDVSGQKSARVPVGDRDLDLTVGQMLEDVMDDLDLPGADSNGRPLVWEARLEREGRNLHVAERVGDALADQDQVMLQPSIDAG